MQKGVCGAPGITPSYVTGAARTTGKPQPVGDTPGPLSQGWGSLQGRDPTSRTADRYRHYLPARGEYHCGPVTEEDTQVLGGASLAHGLLLEVGGPQPSTICSLHGQSVLYKVSTFWGAPLHWIPSPTWHPMFNPTHQGAPSSSRSGSPHSWRVGSPSH